MDLNKEISFKKKDKPKGGKGSSQLKTYINFAEVAKEKTTDWKFAIPAVVIIAVAAYLIARYGVLERFERLDYAEAEVDALQRNLDSDLAIIAGSGDLSEEYYHYTYSGMSTEESDRISRVEVAKLVGFVVSNGARVRYIALKDAQLTMQISASSLQQVSSLTRALEQQDIVSSCAMTTAETKEQESTYAVPAGEPSEEGAEQETETVTAMDIDAQLTVYLKSVGEMQQDEEAAE